MDDLIEGTTADSERIPPQMEVARIGAWLPLLILLAVASCGERSRPSARSSSRTDSGVGSDASLTDLGALDGSPSDATTDSGAATDSGVATDSGPSDDRGSGADAPALDGNSTDSGEGGGSGSAAIRAACAHYIECGGTLQPSQDDCVQSFVTYIGGCAVRQAAADAYSQCLSGLSCSEYHPDTFRPQDSTCADEYQAMLSAGC